jgi:ADP-ribosylglycohydrolase/tetratricopeptide (TPR) repeat protein
LRDALRSYRGRPTIEELLRESSSQQDYTAFLRSFLTIEEEGISGPRLGGSMGDGVYAGLAEVLLSLAGRSGLCLVVDDLTDADPDTLHFLDYFRRKVERDRVLTISTVKLDLIESQLRDLIDKWQRDGSRVSEVPPLEAQDAAELITQLWSGQPLGDDRIAAIVQLTGGNPFFIEQYLGLRLEDASFETADVPRGVEAVIHRRLNRLDQATREFLDAAAVALEASDSLELVAKVAGVEDGQASRLLRRAVEARCLAEDAKGGIAFTQEPLRRVVVKDLGVQHCRALHTTAARWLENTGLFTTAAHHYGRAKRPDDLVRTALLGAERAEHAGLYRTAVQLYELAEPAADTVTVGPRLVRTYLVVGEWQKAEELLKRLPEDAPETHLLRSELCFVHGDFTRARREVELLVDAPSANRLEVLVRLADIHLYLGELEAAAERAQEALAVADSPTEVARCTAIVGAAAFFGGDVDEGEAQFVKAMTLLSEQPLEGRDPVVYTMILGNLAAAHEVRGDWASAKLFHEEALAKRREISDARGVLQSLHAVARSHLALGSLDDGLQSLADAATMASDLGDELEQGKIEHTYVQVDLERGQPSAAVQHAEAALERFRKANTAYDIDHARLSLAATLAANGEHRRAVEEGAAARVDLQRRGFGLLARLYPGLAYSYSERILAGLLGYACGDAFGLPWEGRRPPEIDLGRVPPLPSTAEWEAGSTSDDTALTLLVVESLIAARGADGAEFLARLAERAPSIKGLGPSTTAAIEHFRRTGTPPATNGNTNGALMQSLPVGWAVPLEGVDDRRAWTLELSRATHPGPEACCAALVGSACAAWAIEGAEPSLLLEVARAEAAATADHCGADRRVIEYLDALVAGRWQPDPERLDPDSYETLLRVLWCILEEHELPAALSTAVRLGGDTDTVAALVGGLLGCRLTPAEIRAQLPWSDDVLAPEEDGLAPVAAGLADLRTGRAHG